jgi:selenide, water dikinase
MTAPGQVVRLTQTAHGGGCACKIPPGELDDVIRDLTGRTRAASDLLVASTPVTTQRSFVSTTVWRSWPPWTSSRRRWTSHTTGAIAAVNALSDIYAMGGIPIVAVNLLSWPRGSLPYDQARDVLQGRLDVCDEANCHLAEGTTSTMSSRSTDSR